MVDANDAALADARMLYSACVAEIAGFKQQQWSVTNYTLVLFASISISRVVNDPLSQVEFGVLMALAGIVLAGAWMTTGQSSDAIRTRRERLTYIRQNLLSEELRIAWRGGRAVDERADDPATKTDLLILFRSVHTAGFGITAWVLVLELCAA